MYDYNNKTFRSISNTATGEVSGDTLFHYHQEGQLFWATYEGGAIRKGNMIGIVDKEGLLTFNYQHINQNFQIMTGRCTSVPTLLDDGRIQLKESWEWTSGQQGSGSSIVVEVLA